MSRPTFGPWKISQRSDDHIWVTGGPEGFVVAKVLRTPHDLSEADATLISAAPDLLEAGRLMIQLFRDGLQNKHIYAIVEAMEDAIKKAEGKT